MGVVKLPETLHLVDQARKTKRDLALMEQVTNVQTLIKNKPFHVLRLEPNWPIVQKYLGIGATMGDVKLQVRIRVVDQEHKN